MVARKTNAFNAVFKALTSFLASRSVAGAVDLRTALSCLRNLRTTRSTWFTRVECPTMVVTRAATSGPLPDGASCVVISAVRMALAPTSAPTVISMWADPGCPCAAARLEASRFCG